MDSFSDKVFTVSELTFAIKAVVEPPFAHISVQGEVTNLTAQASGHLYFSLKDASSQISCVLFKGNSKNLPRIPKPGDQVIVKGEISIYPPRGNYQMIVRELAFSGVGDLLLKLHELKERLKAKGFFDEKSKKPLPKFPKTIGIVTSPSGAVIQDIINVLSRRFRGFHLILNPVKVQGEGAKEEIAKAIEDFNRHNLADVLIIGRGGGSLEDLWAFNEEIVAKAIFESQIPTISAVGHETDFSIADFVADVRAPTPSAAAEIVLTEKEAIISTLENFRKELSKLLLNRINNYAILLKSFLKNPLMSSPYPVVGVKMQLIDDLKSSIDTLLLNILEKRSMELTSLKKQLKSPHVQLNFLKERYKNLNKSLKEALLKSLLARKEKFNYLVSHLNSLDPKNLLRKGYSIAFSEKENCVIISKSSLMVSDKLRLKLSDGELKVTVNEII